MTNTIELQNLLAKPQESQKSPPSEAAKIASIVAKVAFFVFAGLTVASAIATFGFGIAIGCGVGFIGALTAFTLFKIAVMSSVASLVLTGASLFSAEKLESISIDTW